MLCVGALVSVRHVGAAPLSGRTRTLSGLSIGSGIWIIGLCRTSASIRCRHRGPSRGSASVRIVRGPSRRRSVWAVGSLRPAVGSCRRIVMGCSIIRSAVRCGVGIVARIPISGPVDVRRVVISAIVSDDCSGRGTQDKRAQIPSCVAGLNGAVGIRGLRDVGHIVNRGARRNRINLFWNRASRCPWPLGIGRHKPHALQAKVIDVSDLDYLVLRVRSISHGRSLD